MSTPVIGITGYADRSARPPNVSIYALSQTYGRAVMVCGGAPVIIPPTSRMPSSKASWTAWTGSSSRGGGDIHPSSYGKPDGGLLWRVDRERDRSELSLARSILEADLPLLAICRGIQVLNVASGGTLIQDIGTGLPNALSHSCVAGRPLPDVAHAVDVVPNTRLAALVGAGRLGVNSAHHQAAHSLGRHLVVTARAPDGIIEGLESPGHRFCLGVQWHPEAMVDSAPVMRRLFEGLIEAARA